MDVKVSTGNPIRVIVEMSYLSWLLIYKTNHIVIVANKVFEDVFILYIVVAYKVNLRRIL